MRLNKTSFVIYLIKNYFYSYYQKLVIRCRKVPLPVSVSKLCYINFCKHSFLFYYFFLCVNTLNSLQIKVELADLCNLWNIFHIFSHLFLIDNSFLSSKVLKQNLSRIVISKLPNCHLKNHILENFIWEGVRTWFILCICSHIKVHHYETFYLINTN